MKDGNISLMPWGRRKEQEEGQLIPGLVAHYNDEQRIYMVTVEPDPLTKQIHDRWPRVMG